MCQSAAKGADKGRWESFAARLQHAQVRKQMSLGARLFTAGPVVYLRVALEQRADVHKDVEDLVFCLPYFVAALGAALFPFGKQPSAVLGVHVKAQHELAEFFQALAAAGLDGFLVSIRAA